MLRVSGNDDMACFHCEQQDSRMNTFLKEEGAGIVERWARWE
jgi:hypothetical protein